MTIVFYCRCGQKVRAPDQLAGQRGRCPQCRSTFKIPTQIESESGASSTAPKRPASAKPKPKRPDADTVIPGDLEEVGTTATFTGTVTEFKGDPETPQRYIIDPETFVVTAEDFPGV